jgi:hypothetical protein
VFPTLDFPSDHALVSAIFTARPPLPADPSAAAAADAAGTERVASASGRWAVPSSPALAPASTASSVTSEGGQGRVGGLSLYEYWGIADSAAALAAVGRSRSGGGLSDLAAAAAADDDADADADADAAVLRGGGGDAAAARAAVAARAVEAWFVRVSRRAAGGRDLDDRREEISRLSDRSIWIVFRPAPPPQSSSPRPLLAILPTPPGCPPSAGHWCRRAIRTLAVS